MLVVLQKEEAWKATLLAGALLTRYCSVLAMTPLRDWRVRKGHRLRPIWRQMRFRTLRPTPSSRAAACRTP